MEPPTLLLSALSPPDRSLTRKLDQALSAAEFLLSLPLGEGKDTPFDEDEDDATSLSSLDGSMGDLSCSGRLRNSMTNLLMKQNSGSGRDLAFFSSSQSLAMMHSTTSTTTTTSTRPITTSTTATQQLDKLKLKRSRSTGTTSGTTTTAAGSPTPMSMMIKSQVTFPLRRSRSLVERTPSERSLDSTTDRLAHSLSKQQQQLLMDDSSSHKEQQRQKLSEPEKRTSLPEKSTTPVRRPPRATKSTGSLAVLASKARQRRSSVHSSSSSSSSAALPTGHDNIPNQRKSTGCLIDDDDDDDDDNDSDCNERRQRMSTGSDGSKISGLTRTTTADSLQRFKTNARNLRKTVSPTRTSSNSSLIMMREVISGLPGKQQHQAHQEGKDAAAADAIGGSFGQNATWRKKPITRTRSSGPILMRDNMNPTTRRTMNGRLTPTRMVPPRSNSAKMRRQVTVPGMLRPMFGVTHHQPNKSVTDMRQLPPRSNSGRFRRQVTVPGGMVRPMGVHQSASDHMPVSAAGGGNGPIISIKNEWEETPMPTAGTSNKTNKFRRQVTVPGLVRMDHQHQSANDLLARAGLGKKRPSNSLVMMPGVGRLWLQEKAESTCNLDVDKNLNNNNHTSKVAAEEKIQQISSEWISSRGQSGNPAVFPFASKSMVKKESRPTETIPSSDLPRQPTTSSRPTRALDNTSERDARRAARLLRRKQQLARTEDGLIPTCGGEASPPRGLSPSIDASSGSKRRRSRRTSASRLLSMMDGPRTTRSPAHRTRSLDEVMYGTGGGVGQHHQFITGSRIRRYNKSSFENQMDGSSSSHIRRNTSFGKFDQHASVPPPPPPLARRVKSSAI